MNNQNYAALLDGAEQTAEERMDAIVAIIQEELQELTERLAMDESMRGRMPMKLLSNRANDSFLSMSTGLEKEYMLTVTIKMCETERYWDVQVTWKKRGIGDRLFVDMPTFVGSRVNINASHLTAGSIDVGAITAGTLQSMEMRALDARHVSIRDIDMRALEESMRGASAVVMPPTERAGVEPFNWGTPLVAEPTDGFFMNRQPLRTEAPAVLAEGSFTLANSSTVTANNGMSTVIRGQGWQTFDSHTQETGLDFNPLDVELREVQEATWAARSLTEDMRELNQGRILEELQSGIRRLAESYRGRGEDAMTTRILLTGEVESLLRRHHEQGSIEGYEVTRINQEWPIAGPQEVRLNVAIRPVQSTETIRMGISLIP